MNPINGTVVDRQLQQIWFAHPKQIEYSQRFIADWTLYSQNQRHRQGHHLQDPHTNAPNGPSLVESTSPQ